MQSEKKIKEAKTALFDIIEQEMTTKLEKIFDDNQVNSCSQQLDRYREDLKKRINNCLQFYYAELNEHQKEQKAQTKIVIDSNLLINFEKSIATYLDNFHKDNKKQIDAEIIKAQETAAQELRAKLNKNLKVIQEKLNAELDKQRKKQQLNYLAAQEETHKIYQKTIEAAATKLKLNFNQQKSALLKNWQKELELLRDNSSKNLAKANEKYQSERRQFYVRKLTIAKNLLEEKENLRINEITRNSRLNIEKHLSKKFQAEFRNLLENYKLRLEHTTNITNQLEGDCNKMISQFEGPSHLDQYIDGIKQTSGNTRTKEAILERKSQPKSLKSTLEAKNLKTTDKKSEPTIEYIRFFDDDSMKDFLQKKLDSI